MGYILSGSLLCIANYLFNFAIYMAENIGVTSILSQISVVIGYFYSVTRYGEEINVICLLGSVLLIGSIYVILFKK